MEKLNKKQLVKIVNEFGNLTERAYSGKFNWEADVGNCMTPLGFAAYTAFCHDDLIQGLIADAAEAASHLFDSFPANMEGREFDDVVDDILRNIAIDAKEELEG